VPEQLYWRRDGGKPVLQLARTAAAQAHTGLSLDDPPAEQRWRTPLITTAYAHMEMFADSRLSGADRLALMREVPAIVRARWLPRAILQHVAKIERANGVTAPRTQYCTGGGTPVASHSLPSNI
jgi:hypothetical protein